jgi:hypothetical protein
LRVVLAPSVEPPPRRRSHVNPLTALEIVSIRSIRTPASVADRERRPPDSVTLMLDSSRKTLAMPGTVPEGALRRGQAIVCPGCRRDTIVQVRPVMDGWRRVGETFACGLCGHRLGAVPADDPVASAKASGQAATNALAVLLGQAPAPPPPRLADAEAPKPFCRDCRHFLRHPFASRCLLLDRPTEPMSDCDRFAPRVEVDPGSPSEPRCKGDV